jgi:hypothetical protein
MAPDLALGSGAESEVAAGPSLLTEGTMTEIASPAVARQRVRLALCEARGAANLTQQEVAKTMEWSLSKVVRIENGDEAVAPFRFDAAGLDITDVVFQPSGEVGTLEPLSGFARTTRLAQQASACLSRA